MKKHHTTIVLLTLFFTGLLVLWWADSADIPTSAELAAQSRFVIPELRKVSDRGDDAIKRVEVQRGDALIQFEWQKPDRWQMEKPIDVAADSSVVSTLVRNLKELQKSREAGAIEGNPASFGLAPPKAVVRLFGKDSQRPVATLELGAESEGLRDSRYVRSIGPDGAPRGIDIIDARMVNMLDNPVVAWREKTLFNSPTTYVSEVTVTGPGRELTAKRDEHDWQLLRPINAPADPERLEGIIAELTSLRVAEGAKGYVADNVKDLAPYGLDKPEMTIEIKTSWAGGEPQVVEIGKHAPGDGGLVYARQRNQDDVVLVSGKELAELGKGKNTLRSKRVANVSPPRAAFVELHAFGRDFRLSRAKNGWFLIGKEREKADSSVILNLLQRLAQAQSSEFLEPSAIKKPGLDPPVMTLKVWEFERAMPMPDEPAANPPAGEPSANLDLGYYDPAKRAQFARIAGDSTILALTKDFADALPKNVLAFRDRTLLTLSPAQVSRLTVFRQINKGSETYVLEGPSSQSNHWKMTAPIAAPADDAQATQMILVLSNLRAHEYVSDKLGDGKAYGLDKPELTVTWALQPDDPTASKAAPGLGTLQVGARVKNGEESYATISGSSMVFTLAPDVIRPFLEELRDHQVLSFAPDKLERIVLRWPDRALSFVPTSQPPGWKPDAGLNAAGFDVSRVPSLVRDLARLNTPKYVQYTGIFPPESGLDSPALTIEIQLGGEKKPRILRVGARSAEGPMQATLVSGSAGPIFLLPGPAWAELARSPKIPESTPKKPDEPVKKKEESPPREAAPKSEVAPKGARPPAPANDKAK
jgi:hypothetical protein